GQMGVEKSSKVPLEEINAYVDLLKKKDGGKAFLRLMRNFDHTTEFRDLCYKAVQNVKYPVQAIWGAKDAALTVETYGEEIKRVAGLKEIHTLPAKHFLQEEAWLSIADIIVEQAKSVHIKTTKKEV
ncbi:MAG: alpha/beta hydrolase, partial [Salinimicrobium sp.]